MDGAPAFRPPSASSGTLPVAAFTTTCQTAKATVGTSPGQVLAPGPGPAAEHGGHPDDGDGATATMTVSLVSAP